MRPRPAAYTARRTTPTSIQTQNRIRAKSRPTLTDIWTRRTTMSVEQPQLGPSLGRTIIVSRAGATNSSATEKDVASTDRVRHAIAHTTRCTTAIGGASCVNKYTTPASATPSGS
ncbi:hypothetical protein PF003_g8790 [Phytophthora fragariae]|nr:hypothetical protein PF003_g8790 [Phytophthora fragariae]